MIVPVFKRRAVVTFGVLVCVAAGVCVGGALYWGGDSSHPAGSFPRGAVVSNGRPCAHIGKKILEKYGNAVDAVIATLICDGVTCPQSMGIGGGFLMTIYIAKERRAYSLIARETAPAAAHRDMFNANSTLAQLGGLSIGVPGELRGYAEAYEKFGGRAPWSELFRDTIHLCRSGVPVSLSLAKSISENRDIIATSPQFRNVFLKMDGSVPEVGDKIKMLKLADTLEVIAKKGANALYNGSLTEDFVKDIQSAGGIITAQDLADYRWEEPATGDFGRLRAFSGSLPGSGALLVFLLRLAAEPLFLTGDDPIDVHRITEAYKYAYGRRTLLADPYFANISQELNSDDFIREIAGRIMSENSTYSEAEHYGGHYDQMEDHGTANIAVVAPNGDAVAATSTINLLFGSKVMSASTGIILNNEMDDFSSTDITNYFNVRPSPVNRVQPGKMPLSSTCPTVIIQLEGGRPRLVIGAAGGIRITTATALATIRHLYYNMTIKEAIDAARFHHQLYPMVWNYEEGVPKGIVEWMKSVGHSVERSETGGCVTGIANANAGTRGEWLLEPYYDPRRPGHWDGF